MAPLSVQSDRGGIAQLDSRCRAALLGELPHPGVGDDSPAEQQARHAEVGAGVERLVSRTSATASRKLAATSATGTSSPASCVFSTHRATAVLSPEKREVVAVRRPVLRQGEPAGEADRLRVAVGGDAVDLRPAGVGQAEQAGDLVEGLARRVVDGLAEQLDVGDEVAHVQQRGVPARDEQGDGRQLEVAAVVAQHVGADVPDEVVDGVEGLAGGERERLGRADPDHERAGQPGAARHRDRVELVERRRPASASAARRAGSIASRWARAATSGTTPP